MSEHPCNLYQELENSRCRGDDTVKRKQTAKLAACKGSQDEDGSDEDRTDETQQVRKIVME